MTVQEIKKHLKGIKRMRHNVRMLEESRDVAWAKITRITPVMEETGVHASKDADRTAEYVAYIEATDSEIADLMHEVRHAAGTINALRRYAPDHPEYSAILYCYYIDDMTWEMTADVVGYSVRQVMRVHGNALLALTNMLKQGQVISS